MKNSRNWFQGALVLGFSLAFAVTASAAPTRFTLKKQVPQKKPQPELIKIDGRSNVKMKTKPRFKQPDKHLKPLNPPARLTLSKKLSLVNNRHKLYLPILLTPGRMKVRDALLCFYYMDFVVGGDYYSNVDCPPFAAESYTQGGFIGLRFKPKETGLYMVDFMVESPIERFHIDVHQGMSAMIPQSNDGHVTFILQAEKDKTVRLQFSLEQGEKRKWKFFGCEITPMR